MRRRRRFLAVDHSRLQDLDEAVRRYLAWESILAEQETLDLSPYQVKQAETQKASADGSVTARMPEAYQWLLVPGQKTPQSAIEWQALRVAGSDALAARASKKLRGDDSLITVMAGTTLRMELDKISTLAGKPCVDQATGGGLRQVLVSASRDGFQRHRQCGE